MVKKTVLVSLLVLFTVVLLQTAQIKVQDRVAAYKQNLMQQAGAVVAAMKADLRPGVIVNCCTATGECGALLDTHGFMIVNNVGVVIYNAGGAASNPATGKMELWNWFTNSKVTRTFTVTAAPKKGWGTPTPDTFVGPWLVKKSEGVAVSVTFTGGSQTTPKTNTKTENACYVIY